MADEFENAPAPEPPAPLEEFAVDAQETAEVPVVADAPAGEAALPAEPTPATAVTETIPPAKPQVAAESVYYVQDTTPMPDPIPEPQPTTPFPAAPVAAPADSFAAPAEAPADPYASAQAAAGMPAGSYQPSPQVGYQQPAQQQPTYQQATGFPVPPAPQPPVGAYQSAVQHQSFAPDPQINPYEQNLTQLSGGMKFGWLVIGLLMGIPGMLLAWLLNVDKHPQVKKDAIMWSVIGFAINIVLGIILTIAFTGIIASAIAGMGSSGYYGGGLYF